MRLLFVSLEYAPGRSGGIGAFYRDLVSGVRRRGVDAAALYEDAAAGAIIVEAPGETVTLAPVAGADGGPLGLLRRRWRLARAVRRYAAETSPDLVETHDWAGPLALSPGRPLLVRLHGAHTPRRLSDGDRPGRLLRLLEGRTLGLADAVAGISRAVARRTAEAFGVETPPQVIPTGVDATRFRPPCERAPSSEILFAGTLRPEKGVEELLTAARRVLVRDPHARLALVGPAPDEGFVARLLGAWPGPLKARVDRVGPLTRQELAERYGAAAVCVFPSRFEALGLTCLEAMSCGAAVVGARGTGHEELITDGVDGRLVDPRDSVALAAAIEEALASPERRAALGDAARRTVLARFTLERAVERNLALYERLRRGVRAAETPRVRAWAA